MGLLGNIARRKKSSGRKELDKSLYKKRDQKLNKAITAGKVPQKDLKALKTVRSQKDSPVKKKIAVKKPSLMKRRDNINKMIKDVTGG